LVCQKSSRDHVPVIGQIVTGSFDALKMPRLEAVIWEVMLASCTGEFHRGFVRMLH
jgi:hypothetical protein